MSESGETPDPRADALRLAREVADSYRSGASPSAPRRRGRAKPSGPTRSSRDDPVELAELLGSVVRNEGWEDQLQAQRVFTDWASIVGDEVAQHSEVVSYEERVVEVRTTSTAWATQLKLLAPRVVARLNAELGDGSVLRIEIRGPQQPSWKSGKRSIRGARGPRDTYG